MSVLNFQLTIKTKIQMQAIVQCLIPALGGIMCAIRGKNQRSFKGRNSCKTLYIFFQVNLTLIKLILIERCMNFLSWNKKVSIIKRWFSSNLNGGYLKGQTEVFAKGMVWLAFRGYHYSLKTSRMMIRPNRNI